MKSLAPRPLPVVIRRLAARTGLGLLLALAGRASAAPAVYEGEVVNLTHDVPAPVRIELETAGETLTGFVEVAPPLSAGRWPLTGVRRGAWCEFRIVQAEDAVTVFRAVLDAAGGLRGTYVFAGGTPAAQYGRLEAKRADEPRSPDAGPAAQPPR